MTQFPETLSLVDQRLECTDQNAQDRKKKEPADDLVPVIDFHGTEKEQPRGREPESQRENPVGSIGHEDCWPGFIS